jgi:PIN domain nuclease of toxin-antitoxin system
VRLLLDTHAFLWFITDHPQLSATAKALIEDPNSEILVSPASYWETAIKVSIGKYPLTAPFETFITQGIDGNGFTILPIEPRHAAVLTTVPFHHRDPFDRMLVAQAQVEKISVVSIDAILDQYGINRLW